MTLIDRWKFDEASGTTATSVGPNNNTMIASGSYTWLPTGGKIDGCVEIAGGSSDYFYITDANAVNLPSKGDGTGPQTFSLTCLVYLLGSAGGGRRDAIMVKQSQAAGRGFLFAATDTSSGQYPYFELYNDAEARTSVQSSTAITFGEWRMVSVTYEYITNGTSKLRLYLDDTLVDSRDDGVGPPKLNTTIFEIGRYYWHGNYIKTLYGRMDEFRVYDHALTQTEITDLYNELILGLGGGDGATVDLGGQFVASSAGNVTVAGSANTNLAGQLISSINGALAASGAASLTLQSQAATTALGVLAASGNATLALSGNALSSSLAELQVTGAATLTLNGDTLNASLGDIAFSGDALLTLQGFSLASAHGALTLSGGATLQLDTQELSSVLGALSVAGSARIVPVGQTVNAQTGDVVIDIPGVASVLLDGQALASNTGLPALETGALFSLTGNNISAALGSLFALGHAQIVMPSSQLDSAQGTIAIDSGATVTTLSGQALVNTLGALGIIGNAGAVLDGQALAIAQSDLSVFSGIFIDIGGHATSSAIGSLTLIGDASLTLNSQSLAAVLGALGFTISNVDMIAPDERKVVISAHDRAVTISH